MGDEPGPRPLTRVLDVAVRRRHRVRPRVEAPRRDAIHFVFGTFEGYGGYTPVAADLEVSAAMQGAWLAFARSGAPSLTPTWTAYDPEAPAIALFETGGPALAGEIRSGRCDSLAALGFFD